MMSECSRRKDECEAQSTVPQAHEIFRRRVLRATLLPTGVSASAALANFQIVNLRRLGRAGRWSRRNASSARSPCRSGGIPARNARCTPAPPTPQRSKTICARSLIRNLNLLIGATSTGTSVIRNTSSAFLIVHPLIIRIGISGCDEAVRTGSGSDRVEDAFGVCVRLVA